MSSERLKLLFIAGYQRSGSTILRNVLAQVPGTEAVGEARDLWLKGLRGRMRCGCGAPARECVFWREILGIVSGEKQGSFFDIESLVNARQKRPLLSMLLGRNEALRAAMREYLESLEHLYWAVNRVTRCRIIIDSSKSPVYGYLLSLIPSLDLHVLHVTRDARSVGASLWKRKLGGHPDYHRYHLVTGALSWSAWNACIELLLSQRPHYLRLRYEDFVSEPRKKIEEILRFMGEGSTPLPFVGDRMVRLEPTHALGGSPSRFQTGTVEIRDNQRWRRDLDLRKRLCIHLGSWPLLLRYGY